MSTKNIQQPNIILARLIQALDAKGYKKHGRVTQLSKISGYSVSMVSDMLRGEADLSERFIIIICSKIGLSDNWIRTGEGEMYKTPLPIHPEQEIVDNEDVPKYFRSIEKRFLWDLINEMTDDEAFELVQELRKRRKNRG